VLKLLDAQVALRDFSCDFLETTIIVNRVPQPVIVHQLMMLDQLAKIALFIMVECARLVLMAFI
jgi:hypothetical protein